LNKTKLSDDELTPFQSGTYDISEEKSKKKKTEQHLLEIEEKSEKQSEHHTGSNRESHEHPDSHSEHSSNNHSSSHSEHSDKKFNPYSSDHLLTLSDHIDKNTLFINLKDTKENKENNQQIDNRVEEKTSIAQGQDFIVKVTTNDKNTVENSPIKTHKISQN